MSASEPPPVLSRESKPSSIPPPISGDKPLGVFLDQTHLNASTAEEPASSDYYWKSYAHFGIHEQMLKDSVRTQAYRSAIVHNAHLFRDKVVLDVGCGTGILSMFACQAGARHVYAVDMSDIVKQAHAIVAANGFGTRITCIQGRIEDIELPVAEVDVIVSEWMGYFLVYENMLRTVLVARDRWLRKDGRGILLPDRATLYVCGIEDARYKDEKIHWWESVYGFDMRVIRDLAVREPIVDVVDSAAVNTSVATGWSLDMYTITVDQLDFSFDFTLEAARQDFIHALVFYFDVDFSKCHRPVGFSTGPFTTYTHWRQTVFYLPEVLAANQGDKLIARMRVFPNAKNHRDMNIHLTFDFEGQYGPVHGDCQYTLH